MNIFDYNRIMIVGNNGSGKSYFAEKLSAITGLPLVHLDPLFWRPNWQIPSQEEWREKNIQLVKDKKWIIDGNVNHGGTMEIRLKAAELIIFLDINRLVCLGSILKRRGKRLGWPLFLEERIDRGFFRLIKEMWTYPKYREQALMKMLTKYPNKVFLIIKSRRIANKLLMQWTKEREPNVG